MAEELSKRFSDILNKVDQQLRKPGDVLQKLVVVQSQHSGRFNSDNGDGDRIHLCRGDSAELGAPTEILSLDYVSTAILDRLFEAALDNHIEELQVLPRVM